MGTTRFGASQKYGNPQTSERREGGWGAHSEMWGHGVWGEPLRTGVGVKRWYHGEYSSLACSKPKLDAPNHVYPLSPPKVVL